MHWIDYTILLVPFVITMVISWRTRGLMKGVADFMAASRSGGRYLVCNASGEAAFGAISAVALFEYINKTGFSMTWWGQIGVPVSLLMTLTGFVVYRYRETRVLTMAQFFEIRYGRGFRILTGFLAFVSGMLNYGIFPAVGARFFVNYCGLPQSLEIIGLHIPMFAVLMAVFISFALFLTLVGGQLTIMISDCLEGLLSGFLYLAVAGALVWMFQWKEIYEALAAAPKGQSMLNPFDTSAATDFNFWFVLIGTIGNVYSYMSWQGGHAFRACAASPHEAKMGGILGSWRGVSRSVMITLLGICAFTFLNHPHYASGAAQVAEALKAIPEKQIQAQMTVPVALRYMLPIGIKGAFACIMFFAMLACDGSYMHSWGSILVQDVILPLQKKPMSPRAHIALLRCCIAGVGVFAFFFGLLFQQTEYIFLFFAVTGAIFTGGSGCAVLGGLYWKKGTNLAAWVSMVTGSTLATMAIILQERWTMFHPYLIRLFPDGVIYDYLSIHIEKFPVNGQYIWLGVMCVSVILYVVISLLTCREDFDMDKMLHRGRYALQKDHVAVIEKTTWKLNWRDVLGFDEEFTFSDKLISISVLVWSLFWFSIFVVGSIWYLLRPFPLEVWGTYWYIVGIIVPFLIGSVTTIWFTWGGISDLRALLRDLRTLRPDELDDGTVLLVPKNEESVPDQIDLALEITPVNK